MALGSTKKFHQQIIAAGMPKSIADHEAPRIDSHMKRAILKLYRSAKNPGDWSVDFSTIADRGMVMWGVDDPFVPIRFAKVFCERWNIPLAEEKGVGHWEFANAQMPLPHIFKRTGNGKNRQSTVKIPSTRRNPASLLRLQRAALSCLPLVSNGQTRNGQFCRVSGGLKEQPHPRRSGSAPRSDQG